MKKTYYLLFIGLFILVGCMKKNDSKTNALITDSLELYFVKAKDKLLSDKQSLVFNQKAEAIVLKQKQDSLHIKISDSLQLIERNIRSNMIRIVFEMDELAIEKDKLEEQNRNIIIWSSIILFIAVLLYVIRYQQSKNKELIMKEAQQQANEEIYNLLLSQHDRMEEVRQNEKKRISQDLHDGILGRLFGARLNLDALNKKQDEESVKKREAYIHELKSIEQDIREISHDLNEEKDLVTNNFVAITTNLIEKQETLTGIKVTFTIEEAIQWETIDNVVKINLYRIIQEFFHNSNKYAQAKNIVVSISKENNIIKVIISDDGIGFDTNNKVKGIGLQNMQSRAKSMGAILKINSNKGTGTKIGVIIAVK